MSECRSLTGLRFAGGDCCSHEVTLECLLATSETSSKNKAIKDRCLDRIIESPLQVRF